MNDVKLWEILVPSSKPEHLPGKNRFFSVRYHREWDKKVAAVSNGLTVLQPSKGRWLSSTGELQNERMIAVRVACTREQILKIMEIAAEHYHQEAIMVHKVSDEVIISHFNCTKE